MRFFHIADLHLGKMLHGYSLIEQGDQTDWIDRFLDLVDAQRPNAVVIAGDVYDRAVPSREAVVLLDRFLTALCERNVPVLLISGNHDSGTRLNFASGLLQKQGLHIAGSVQEHMQRVTISDEYGPVHFYLMPYLFPAAVEEALGTGDIRSYDAAARMLIDAQPVDTSARNVLVGHQFVLAGKDAPLSGGSETMVGGVGQIDYTAFDAFDYVALGHIHRPQCVGRESVRYAGSLLCYHFSEIGWEKGPLLVEIGAKGEKIKTTLLAIEPKHPMREIRGKFSRIVEEEEHSAARGEYIRVVLTDRELPSNAVDTLRSVFQAHASFLMDVQRDPEKTDTQQQAHNVHARRSIEQLFEDFYRQRMGGELLGGLEQELIGYAAQLASHAQEDATPEEKSALAQKIVQFALGQEDAK